MSNRRNNRSFYAHDDRDAGPPDHSSSSNRGGWRNGRGGGHFRGRSNNRHYSDGGQDMRRERRQNSYGRGRGGAWANKAHIRRPMRLGSGWRRILVSKFGSATKDEVISTLKSHVESDFSPIKLSTENPDVIEFFLDRDPSAEEALLALSNRISAGSGPKLIIRSDGAFPRPTNLNDAQKTLVEVVMGKRYNVEKNSLNLSNFHRDPEFLDANIYCPVDGCIDFLMQIIMKNVPNVAEIDFTNNKLMNLNGFEPLLQLTHLQKLNFFMNRIPSITAFVRLKGLGITELSLGQNQCSHKPPGGLTTFFKKCFPNLHKLDDKDLIGFETDEPSKLPETKSSYFCSEEAKSAVLQFIDQYFQVYESSDRSVLQAAYTEDAKFSVVVEQGLRDPALNSLIGLDRNLMGDNDLCSEKQLTCGRANITKLLCILPKATHDPTSFIVDIPLATPGLMHVILKGLVRIGSEDRTRPVLSFLMSLVIVPEGTGLCISNEELSIMPTTPEQKRMGFQKLSTEAVAPTVQPAASDAGAPEQQRMIAEFSANSKMLPKYSKECLEMNNWDFNKAAAMFVSLKNENKIPPEYYDPSLAS